MWNMVFPLWTLPNSVPQIVGRRQLLAWCRLTEPIGNAKRYLVALTASNGMASFKTGFLHKQAGSDRNSIEVRSRSKRSMHPFSQRETQQQAEPNSSRQNAAAGRSQQQHAEPSSRQKAASRRCKDSDSSSSSGGSCSRKNATRRKNGTAEALVHNLNAEPESGIYKYGARGRYSAMFEMLRPCN